MDKHLILSKMGVGVHQTKKLGNHSCRRHNSIYKMFYSIFSEGDMMYIHLVLVMFSCCGVIDESGTLGLAVEVIILNSCYDV